MEFFRKLFGAKPRAAGGPVESEMKAQGPTREEDDRQAAARGLVEFELKDVGDVTVVIFRGDETTLDEGSAQIVRSQLLSLADQKGRKLERRFRLRMPLVFALLVPPPFGWQDE